MNFKHAISDELRRQLDDVVTNWKTFGPTDTTFTALAFEQHVAALQKKKKLEEEKERLEEEKIKHQRDEMKYLELLVDSEFGDWETIELGAHDG